MLTWPGSNIFAVIIYSLSDVQHDVSSAQATEMKQRQPIPPVCLQSNLPLSPFKYYYYSIQLFWLL